MIQLEDVLKFTSPFERSGGTKSASNQVEPSSFDNGMFSKVTYQKIEGQELGADSKIASEKDILSSFLMNLKNFIKDLGGELTIDDSLDLENAEDFLNDIKSILEGAQTETPEEWLMKLENLLNMTNGLSVSLPDASEINFFESSMNSANIDKEISLNENINQAAGDNINQNLNSSTNSSNEYLSANSAENSSVQIKLLMLEQEATSSHRRILSRQTILKNQNDTLEKLDNSLAANNKQMNSQVALGLASGSQLKDLEMKELSSLKIDENNRNSSQNEIETSPAKTGKEDFDLKKDSKSEDSNSKENSRSENPNKFDIPQNEQNIASLGKPKKIDVQLLEMKSQVDNTPQGTKHPVVTQVVQKMEVMILAGKQQMVIQLSPDHLGQVEIRIDIEDDVVRLNVRVENDQVKQILESSTQILKDNLSNQNVHLDKIDVQTDTDFSKGHYAKEKRDREANQSDSQRSADGKLELETEETQGETGRKLGYNTIEYLA
jgi:flagellar hook-length control protein FliK